jgi:ribonucleoside-triphosphate reductase
MVVKVVKRDGREEEFRKEKIKDAVLKAFNSVDGMVSDDAVYLAEKIADEVTNVKKQSMGVEDIQDIVENKLMHSARKDVAREYIIYRNERTKTRERNSDFMNDVSEKLYAKNVENQNANVDEKSFGGRIGAASSALTKKYALDYIVSPMARRNHLNNEIYIHDLDSYAVGNHNCLSIPFDDLLANGFNTRQTDVRPANSINTAMQLVAVIFQIQSLQQFGGVSATHLDWTMVPYVRKSFRKHFIDGIKYCEPDFPFDIDEYAARIPADAGIEDGEYKMQSKAYRYAMDMTEKEVHQSVEGMYHNLNIRATQ